MDTCPGCQTSTDAARCPHCGVALRPGRYTVHKVIGETDHSRVYQATSSTGAQVALKELTFSRLPTAQILTAFEQEVRILRSLRHKRIPDFVGSFQEGDGVNLRLYLAQEFISGQSLLQLVEERHLAEGYARKVADQLLRILIYLQSISPPVFHRDIKPANIVLHRNGKLVLVDFGAARDSGTTVGATQVGTFGYMAPEQLTGIVSKSTDLYGLGATLVQLLARRPPWQIDRAEMHKVINTTERFRRFLLMLWCVDPQQRLPDARTALAALRSTRSQRMIAAARREPEPVRGALQQLGEVLVATRATTTHALEHFFRPDWRSLKRANAAALAASVPVALVLGSTGAGLATLPLAVLVHVLLLAVVSRAPADRGGRPK